RRWADHAGRNPVAVVIFGGEALTLNAWSRLGQRSARILGPCIGAGACRDQSLSSRIVDSRQPGRGEITAQLSRSRHRDETIVGGAVVDDLVKVEIEEQLFQRLHGAADSEAKIVVVKCRNRNFCSESV